MENKITPSFMIDKKTKAPITLLDRYKILRSSQQPLTNEENNTNKCFSKLNFLCKKTNKKVKNFFSYFNPFDGYIYKVQCDYGQTTASYFSFHREMFILNLIIGIIAFAAALIPQVVGPNQINRNTATYKADKINALSSMFTADGNNQLITSTVIDTCYDKAVDPYNNLTRSTAVEIIGFISGQGVMGRWPILYDWFDGRYETTNLANYQNSVGILAIYQGAVLLSFLLSLAFVIHQIAQSRTKKLNDEFERGQYQKMPLAKTIFTKYDFTVTKNDAVAKKKAEVTMVLRGILQEAEITKEKNRLRSNFYRYRWLNQLFLKRALGRFLVLLVILGGFALVIASIWFQAKYPILLNQQQLANIESFILWKYLIDYLPQIVQGIFPVIAQILIAMIVNMECRSTQGAMNLNLIRNIICQLFIFLVFVVTNILLATCYGRDEFFLADESKYDPLCESCEGMENCWETKLGSELFKMMSFQFLIQFLMVVFMRFPIAMLAKANWCKFINQKSPFFYLVFMLNKIRLQTIVFTGMFLAPSMPLINAILDFVMFYVFYISARYFQVLPIDTKGNLSSQGNDFKYYSLLLGWGIGWVSNLIMLVVIRPSQYCGGFLVSMWHLLTLAGQTKRRTEIRIFDAINYWLPQWFIDIFGKTVHAYGFTLVILGFYMYLSHRVEGYGSMSEYYGQEYNKLKGIKEKKDRNKMEAEEEAISI